MGSRTWIAIAIVASGMLSACGVPIVAGSHFARDLTGTRGATFAWDQSGDLVLGDPRLEGNSFFEDRLHEAVEWHLALRGIRLARSSPTFVAHHHLTLTEHEYVEEVMDDAGIPWTQSYTYEQGSVAVHLVDAATGETVWLAWAQADIRPALAGPDQMQAWVYGLVNEMFRRWPIPSRTGE